MQPELFELHASIEDTHWWFVGRRQIMRRLTHRIVPPGTGARVVDIGCGTGANIAVLSPDYACTGIDTSSRAIAFARARFPAVDFICGNAPADLGSAAESASLFLLMDVLEHVPDDFLLLSTILAAMRPGTYLIITVPAEEALWSPHDESFGHYRRYDRSRLEQAWQGLPVTATLVSYYNARLYPVVKLVRLLSAFRKRASGEHGTDFSVPPSFLNRALTRAFAGEGSALEAAMDGRTQAPYPHGVSLIAVLRREPGVLAPRTRPPEIPADLHVPAATGLS
jgi:SAM-dependent methyltransferase